MKNMKISIARLIIFIAVIIGLLALYYKKVSASEKSSKGLKLLKLIFNLFIVSGSLKALYDVKTVDGKIIVIIVLALLINFNNLKYNIKGCNYPSLYKIKLTFRSSIIIIVSILTLWYCFDNDIYSFLYIETEEEEEDWFTNLFGSIDIEDEYNKDLSYCPDMSKEDYKDKDKSDYSKWNALTNEQQNNCLTKIITKTEREDVDAGIYA